MSYEKVNSILEGLKIDEAGVRNFKEIILQIDNKLNEIDSEDTLKDILKYVTGKVDNPEVKIYKYMYKLPLSPRDNAEKSFLDCCMYEIHNSIFTGIEKLLNISDKETYSKISVDANYRELESDFGSPFKDRDCLLLYDTVTLKDVNMEDKDKKNIIKLIESIFKKKIPDFYKNKEIKKEITTNKRGSADNETVFIVRFYLPVSWA